MLNLALLLLISSLAVEAKPGVSLLLSEASAERQEQDILFSCDASLDNATGKDLALRSNFSSAFDGLELVVTTTGGKTLIQQPYIFHQSPFAPPGREFTLAQGATKAKLVFPVVGLPAEVKVVKVRLVGTLPGSDYRRILSTETKEIKVRD